jgi:hypothetical protein
VKAHNPEHVIAYFGGPTKTQRAFGLDSKYSVYYWRYRGLMPYQRAREAEELSGGKLVFDPKQYRRRN